MQEDDLQQILNELLRKIERQRAGLLDERIDLLTAPIQEHIHNYEKHLKGNHLDNVRVALTYIKRIVNATKVKNVDQKPLRITNEPEYRPA